MGKAGYPAGDIRLWLSGPSLSQLMRAHGKGTFEQETMDACREAIMDTIRSDLVLLGIDPRRPRLRGSYLSFALAGSLLIDLNSSEKVRIGEKDIVERTDSSPPENELAAEALALIYTAKKPKPASHWISVFASRIPHLVERSADPLVSTGILRIKRRRWLGVIPYRVFELMDRSRCERRVADLLDVLRGRRDPDPETIHLIQLAHAAGLLISWLPKDEKKQLLNRLKQFGRDETVGKAVDAATAAIAASVATTVAITAVTAGTD